MIKYLNILLGGCLVLTSFSGYPATTTKSYAYSMKITVNRPKGSVAETSSKDKAKPSTIAFTPCNDAVKQDVLSFQLAYDAGKITVNKKDPTASTSTVTDTYLFFYNPSARGEAPADATDVVKEQYYPQLCERNGVADVACDPKVVAVVRPTMQVGLTALVPLVDVFDIDATAHTYLSADENLGGKISETLMRSYIRFDELQKGIWSLVGIVGPKVDPADPTAVITLNFSDPSTWAAWDAATFMLGAPWTYTGQTASLTCD